MADHSVRWEEPLVIRARPLVFPRCLMPIFSSTSKAVHLEIRASFETTMLGPGELVGRVETTLEDLLAHDGQFEISPVTTSSGQSLPLRARLVSHNSVKPSEIDLLTDAAHEAYAFYRNTKSGDLDRVIKDFEVVLDRCPVGHPHRAAALSNLAHSILYGFTQSVRTDIDVAISYFRSALELRPQAHPDHMLSVHDLCKALHQHYLYQRNHDDLREVLKLYLELLPNCLEGSHLQVCVIEECNTLPSDASDESISLRRTVFERCSQEHGHLHQYHALSLSRLVDDLALRFHHLDSPGDIDECISLSRKALALHPVSHLDHRTLLSNLLKVLKARYDRFGSAADLEEANQLEGTIHGMSSTTLLPPNEEECIQAQVNEIQERSPDNHTPNTGEQQQHRPPEEVQLNQHPTRTRARNIVIFGDTGSGKSSLINTITRSSSARISNDAVGCTSSHEEPEVYLDGKKFTLIDTAGLSEGSEGTAPAAKAEKDLKTLVRDLTRPGSDGIGLLVYCVRTVRKQHALAKNVRLVSKICGEKVPIVIVVTGLEGREPTMESWWGENGMNFEASIKFKDHACVTTLSEGGDELFTQRIRESSEVLRRLILDNFSEVVGDSRRSTSKCRLCHMR